MGGGILDLCFHLSGLAIAESTSRLTALSISNCFSLTAAVRLSLAQAKPGKGTAASSPHAIVRANVHKSLCKFVS